MFHLLITGPAKHDIQIAYDWWAANRSRDQANRWYQGIQLAIESLSNMPERCALASEAELFEHGIRQLLFGIGRRRTHRILFGIDRETVVIFRVRHTSQDVLSLDDLE
jgi:plasmid stabilization system protein ParE